MHFSPHTSPSFSPSCPPPSTPKGYNPQHGSLVALAVASDFRGPYESVVNVTEGLPGDEDPFVWAIDSTNVHLIWHNRGFGYHGWGSIDGVNPVFHVSPTQSHAFTLNVSVDDGSFIHLNRRERPFLRFNDAGAPIALINGVQDIDRNGPCFSFQQPIAVK